MRGHVRKQGNAWYVVVDLPRDHATGKRKQKWHSGLRTKRDADRRLTEILSRLDLARLDEADAPSIDLRNLRLARRDADQAAPRVAPVAIAHRHSSERDVLRFSRVRASRRLRADCRLRPCATSTPSSVRHSRTPYGGISSRGTSRMQADAPRQSWTQIRTWSARELRAFLSPLESDRFYAAYVVAGTTGMRRGEVLGLRWQDVDLDTARVSVVRSLTVVGGYEVQFSDRRRHADAAWSRSTRRP